MKQTKVLQLLVQGALVRSTANEPQFSALIMADWGGHGTSPFTTPGELAVAEGMASLIRSWAGRYGILDRIPV
jgi:hypothetical protein